LDLDPRQLSPMPNGPMVAFAASIFERDDLFVFELFQDFPGNFGSFDERGSGGKTIAVTVQNHLAECNLVAGRSREFFDSNGISRANPILLTSRPNNGVRHGDLPGKARNISHQAIFHNSFLRKKGD
jgi:hypothetical protein